MIKANDIIDMCEVLIGVTDSPLDLSGYEPGRYITLDLLQDDPKYYEIVSVGSKTILARDPDNPSERFNFPIEKTAIVDMQTPYTEQEIERYKIGKSAGPAGTSSMPKGGKESQDWHNRNYYTGDIELGVAGTKTARDKINQVRAMRPGLSKLQPKNKRSLIRVRNND